MAWICLIFAGAFEIMGALSLNRLNKDKSWKSIILLIGCFSLSFLLLSQTMKTISMGTAYAVWTGIGTVGSTIVGMFLYGESKDWRRLLFISMVVIAAIGLKLVAS
ncbi:QacE family quaternary ammonium compound efflux SMR transporter [Paenibacillus sp. LMG 31460]|uniref:QacE family quaternary ammonium compound efflux SMR transporter n=1 Tax=Paenibacillus germinis TaxID=2654979 RepID=A0ABX1Z3L3_9BACL|nr:SMR family transporter [Paenibacillus germinis]NOU87977.1 QacE family quaternary ammonium compound efflux SMR transporter [Paenibacillus germinis]